MSRICSWWPVPVCHDWQAIFECVPDAERERLPSGKRKLYPARITGFYCRTCGVRRSS